MKPIANLLFEIRLLRDITRSGYAFLGAGKESIAEHSFVTAMICFVMTRMEKGIDREKLISMALVHDLAEARTGDLNYVHKQYCAANEKKALEHLGARIPFGQDIIALVEEFNEGKTREACLAKDADQISFIMELKKQADLGVSSPHKWLPIVIDRVQTDLGRQLVTAIMDTSWDDWWLDGYSE